MILNMNNTLARESLVSAIAIHAGDRKTADLFYSAQYILEHVQNVVELSLCFTGIKGHNQILCLTSVVLIEF